MIISTTLSSVSCSLPESIHIKILLFLGLILALKRSTEGDLFHTPGPSNRHYMCALDLCLICDWDFLLLFLAKFLPEGGLVSVELILLIPVILSCGSGLPHCHCSGYSPNTFFV